MAHICSDFTVYRYKKNQIQSHNRKLPVEEQQIRAADDGWSQLLT